MPRTQVYPTDILSAIVVALNGVTVNGGTIKAVVDGQTLRITAHTDGNVLPTNNWNLVLH